MVKKPTALEDYITRNSEWFEKAIIATCRADMEYFKRYRIVLCLKSGSLDTHADDFEEFFHNIIYAALRDYNSLFENASAQAFSPMGDFFLRGWLTGKSNEGKFVSASEIDDVVAYFDKHIATFPLDDATKFVVNSGIAFFLQACRAKKIIHSASLIGTNLDDLSLICENDLELIRKLTDGGKIIKDAPDRIQMSDIDEFDDPNKLLVETIDCDIPKLNETISSFRKGHAYLFIGGTGSGKTIIACQLCCAFSYGGNATGLYISTEQKHDELYRRIVSNRCTIPHKSISQGIFANQLTPREKQLYVDFRRKVASVNTGMAQFINWGNFEKDNNINITKRIESEIDIYEKECGKKVDYVILDWIGGALGSMADAGDRTRHIYQAAADALEELCRKRNFVAIAFAQAVPAAVNKVKIDSQDLAECKTMGRNYSAIIGISSLYSEEYAKVVDAEKSKKRKDFRVSDLEDAPTYGIKQFMFVSKSRFGEPKAVPFKREYEFQRIASWV